MKFGVQGWSRTLLIDFAALTEERAAFLRSAATRDQAEGLRAFIEKRRATFTGR